MTAGWNGRSSGRQGGGYLWTLPHPCLHRVPQSSSPERTPVPPASPERTPVPPASPGQPMTSGADGHSHVHHSRENHDVILTRLMGFYIFSLSILRRKFKIEIKCCLIWTAEKNWCYVTCRCEVLTRCEITGSE